MTIADRFNALPIAEKIKTSLRFKGVGTIIINGIKLQAKKVKITSTTEATSDLKIMEECMQYLESFFPDIYLISTAYTKSIHLQRSTQLSGYSGFSNYYAIGHIDLYNLHYLGREAYRCSSAIIHEGMHQFMFNIEDQYGFFLSRTTMVSEEEVSSPWTGKRLSFINVPHATAVWYGLYCYWKLLAESCTSPDASALAIDQMCKIYNGFHSDSFKKLIRHFDNSGEATALSILSTLQTAIEDLHED
jgi:hypothetical protein